MKPLPYSTIMFLHHQGPSASAYVTYIRSEDALRAIQCVNNVVVDGRTLKVRMKTSTHLYFLLFSYIYHSKNMLCI